MQDGTTQEVTTDPTQKPRMRGTGLKVRLGESKSRILDRYVAQGLISVREAETAELVDGEVFVLDERRPSELIAAGELKKAVEGAGVRAGVERDQLIVTGIRAFISKAGEGAQQSGWHEDRPVRQPGEGPNVYGARLRNWQGVKIMLMVSELAEGVEELRKGHEANHTYYPTSCDADEDVNTKGVFHKPEGLPSELADTAIRIADFCFTEGVDLGEMIIEKLQFNQTRGKKHGGKAV